MQTEARQSWPDITGVLTSSAAARVSPEIALVRLLQLLPSAAELWGVLSRCSTPATAALADAVRRLIDESPEGVRRAAELLRDGGPEAADTDGRIAAVARWFDAAVQKSEEASVAVYSFGSAERLEQATTEVVAVLENWGVIRAESVILQIGCGIGRFEAKLASRVRRAHGIDVSPRMIEAARRRCSGLSNVEFDVCTGRDLSQLADRSFDLVYAIDSFPYVVDAGPSVLELHFLEAERLLRSGGDFVIFNFSYRGDLAADRVDVERLARHAGFEVLRNGEHPLCTWDAAGFHLRVAD